MSENIKIEIKSVKIPGLNMQSQTNSLIINKNSTLKDCLIKFRQIKNGIIQQFIDHKEAGIILLWQRKELGRESIDNKLSELEITDSCTLYIVCYKMFTTDKGTRRIDFSDIEENKNEENKNGITIGLSKLKKAFAVLATLLLIAAIATLIIGFFYEISMLIPIVLFISCVIVFLIARNHDNIVPKIFKYIPCCNLEYDDDTKEKSPEIIMEHDEYNVYEGDNLIHK